MHALAFGEERARYLVLILVKNNVNLLFSIFSQKKNKNKKTVLLDTILKRSRAQNVQTCA